MNPCVRDVPNIAARSLVVLRDHAQCTAISGKLPRRQFNEIRNLMADPARFELTTSAFGGTVS
jgi:hypothetical protein